MKTHLIFPIAAAILGFAAGWLLKPAPPAGNANPQTGEARPPRPATPKLTETPPSDGPANREVPTGKTLSSLPPVDVRNRDDAKLARLAEALSLSDEQKLQLAGIFDKAENILNPGTPLDQNGLIEAAINAGASIETALSTLLTPEQMAAFQSLRDRARDNNIENNAQKQISELSKLTDLSPEQRSRLLDLSRDDLRAKYASRPAGLDLMLDTSVVPVGSRVIAESSVDHLLFSRNYADPAEAATAYTDLQRRNLDAGYERVKDLLTPAQQARLKIDIEEKKNTLETVRGFLR